ncbi:hypothetical protein, partial [Ferruginibacter sp.]
NNSELKAYQMQTKGMIIIPIKNTDVYAIIQKKNGQSYKQELYYGSNYLSQTSRKLIVSKEVVHITLVDNKGIKREQILK